MSKQNKHKKIDWNLWTAKLDVKWIHFVLGRKLKTREKKDAKSYGGKYFNSEGAGVLVTVVMATWGHTHDTVGGDDVSRAKLTCEKKNPPKHLKVLLSYQELTFIS